MPVTLHKVMEIGKMREGQDIILMSRRWQGSIRLDLDGGFWRMG